MIKEKKEKNNEKDSKKENKDGSMKQSTAINLENVTFR